ncbi:ferrous iron transporter B [uncultured Adlercreutzia sp.]|uniref:ferrous iron transporter B n=1 Tax=uncultured Adlercreutzia sp. TaxID=875803 RepID=UPI0026776229|nr:ferrous iron transporter B [uncultured Adlercreutzia sp.]
MAINIALAGNPNCGKTTMFNDLTGANQYVGNWPGVTVEKKEGKYRADKDVTITDLPGVYSLSPYTPEEIVTRDYLMSGKPDVVINLVDATNLERNLYLTTQIIDLGIPVVLALNMMDLVEKNGDVINVAELSRHLGCPVVETSALKGRGMDALMERAIAEAKKGVAPTTELGFDQKVEEALAKVIDIAGARISGRHARWYAIKLLEGEQLTIDKLDLPAGDLSKIAAVREALENAEDDDAESLITNERYDAITDVCAECVKKSPKAMTTTQKIDRVVTNRILGIPIFIVIMFFVYYISVSTVGTLVTDWANDGLFGDGWLYTNTEAYEADVEEYEGYQAEIDAYLEAAEEDGLDVEAFSEALEAEDPTAEDEEVIENFIYAAESANVVGEMEVEDEETGEVAIESVDSAAFAEALEAEEPDPADYGFYHVGVPVVVEGWLEAAGAAPWVQSLVLDGIIAGVGAVIGFIPQLIVLFILLGFLEGCGYMARVAFIMDRIFRRFGLSGKSFIPMLIASGCGVPAVMATKTIENEKDRRMTIMTTTMIPCGAKLPIIALVFGALAGGDYEATWWVAPLFYFLGLAAIIISCIILKKFRAFAGEVAPFIMELPQYHLPTVKNVLLSMWERVRSYVVKAGTIIFLSSMVIWFLLNFGMYEGSFGLLDPDMDDYIQYSLMAGLGNLLAWIFAPLGFGNWESTVTSITGLVAKENVVATVGVITSLGDEIGETDPSLWSSFAVMLGGSSAAIMAFCAFNLLCAPCFAAIGTIRRQMMSAKWTWAAIGYMTVFAWCVGLMVYQFVGLATGEVAFGPFTALAVVVAAGMLFLLFRPAAKAKPSGQLEAAADNA